MRLAIVAVYLLLATMQGSSSTAQTCQLSIALVLDVSGSMRNVVPEWNLAKAIVQLDGVRFFVSEANSDWKIGVVEYRDDAVVKSEATTDKNAILASLSGEARGDTNLAEGINAASSVLRRAEYGQFVMIIVGDGNPNIGVNPRQRAIEAAADAKTVGIYILAAGLTLSPSAYALMTEISSNAKHTLNGIEANSLRAWFHNLNTDLCSIVKESDVAGTNTSPSERNIWAWVALAALLVAVSLIEHRDQITSTLDIKKQISTIGTLERRLRTKAVSPGEPPISPRFCDHCGRQVSSSDNFCDVCGRTLSRR